MSAEIVKKIFEAMETQNFDTAAELVSDDFTFSGPVPEPVGKQEWVGMQHVLLTAFPDWKFNASYTESGNSVQVDVQVTGTHNGELDLSMLGIPTVGATGKALSLPQEQMTATFEGGKMTSLVGQPVEGGGVMGILGQLGIEPPPQH